MRKAMTVMITLLLLLSGCKTFFPPPPEEAAAAEIATQEGSTQEVPPPKPQSAEEAAEAVISQVVEEKKEYEEVQAVVVNDTNATVVTELKISGNLKLQESLRLCPHLATRFDCDKYDLARCGFATLVSQNKFHPDHISCRSGYDYKGENVNHKYCFIQECRPIEKNNIVDAYGGTVAYAEYIYSVEKVEGGIMTHYILDKCGEEKQEFKTSYDCRIYKSNSKNV